MQQQNNRPTQDGRNEPSINIPLSQIREIGSNVNISLPTHDMKVPPARQVATDVAAGWLGLLARPTLPNFREMSAKTTWTTAIASVLLTGVVMGVINAIQAITNNLLSGLFNGPIALVMTPVTTVIGFFLISWLLNFAARRMGGNGAFAPQTKLLGLIMPVLGLSLLLLGFNFFLFTILGGLLGAYSVFLIFQMLRAVHGLDQQKAGILVLLPALLVLIGIIF